MPSVVPPGFRAEPLDLPRRLLALRFKSRGGGGIGPVAGDESKGQRLTSHPGRPRHRTPCKDEVHQVHGHRIDSS
jgi:hypothetical protein